jgi:uncharacterized membrane protein YkoI
VEQQIRTQTLSFSKLPQELSDFFEELYGEDYDSEYDSSDDDGEDEDQPEVPGAGDVAAGFFSGSSRFWPAFTLPQEKAEKKPEKKAIKIVALRSEVWG